MSWTATAGEKCRVLIPVHPDFGSPYTPEASTRLTAEKVLVQLCAEQGLAATGQHLLWSGSCQEARDTEHATAVTDLPDSMLVFVYEATAA